MSTLTITRGLPGSGKTTWAKEQVQSSPKAAARINRDEIREARFGRVHGLSNEQEKEITAIGHAQALGLLKGGVDVYVDDTNLHFDSVKGWQRVAHKARAEFEWVDFPVPVEECINRSYKRAAKGGRLVPADAIQRMAKRYLTADGHFRYGIKPLNGPNLTPFVAPEDPDSDVYIIDIDGTLTMGPHNRSPYDWSKVGQDLPRVPMLRMLDTIWDGDKHADLIFLSGRDETCRPQTREWLTEHLGEKGRHSLLYMRPEGDWRRDDIIKSELFDKHIRDRYNVLGVFDDRQQVVDYWRAIGLQVFQVDKGEF